MDFKELEKQLGIENNETEEDINELNKELDDLMELLDKKDDEIIDIENNLNNTSDIDELLKQDENIELEDIDTDVINDVATYDMNRKDLGKKEIEEISKLEDIEETDEKISEEDKELLSNDIAEIDEIYEDEEAEEVEQKLNEEENDTKDLETEDTNTDEQAEELNFEHMSLEEFEGDINKKNKIGSIIIYSTVGILVLAIIMSTTFFAIAINKIKAKNLEKEIAREKEKVQATYIPEEKNAAYLGLASVIDNVPITLEKILIDPIYIKFYINSNINPMNYDIKLTDRMESLYAMDTNFIKTENGKIELRFSYINNGATEYNLSLKSLATGEFIEFKFDIPNINKSSDVKYLNYITENKSNGVNINITGGTFSTTGSSIYYSIEADENSGYKVQQGFLGNEDCVSLFEENKPLEVLNNKPILQEFKDGVILGRMDFENVSNMNSNLVATFKELYKKFPINKTISLSQINQQNNNEVEFDFDEYKLFVESLPRFDDLFVLVFHAEDTTISTENRNENYNHTEVLLDAELILETTSGMEIILKPTDVTSASYGTDMLFKIDEKQMAYLSGLTPDKIKVRINSALIKMEDVYIPINLGRAMNRKLVEDETMLEEIKNAFISRLEHKYNLGRSIEGISSEVLNDSDLIKEYEITSAKNPKFNINIISQKLDKDKLYAIVQEVIKYELNGEEVVSYKTHNIQATYSERKWTIISDKIIK